MATRTRSRIPWRVEQSGKRVSLQLKDSSVDNVITASSGVLKDQDATSTVRVSPAVQSWFPGSVATEVQIPPLVVSKPQIRCFLGVLSVWGLTLLVAARRRMFGPLATSAH